MTARIYCLECKLEGGPMALSTARELAKGHNIRQHDGDGVADIEEVRE